MPINREKVLEAAQKFVEKKKYDKAIVEYQKIIQEDPNDARILLKVGDLQSKMEAYADAIVTYERVGKFYAHQGFSLKAIAVYKQIREIIAKHVPALDERYAHIPPLLAELYQQLGLTSDALAALDEVATRLQRQQHDQEAIEVFQRIVELDPTNPLPHLRLAEAYSRIKDADAAVREFGVAATVLVKLGRRDDAIKVFERLLHHKPDATNARVCAQLYLDRAQPADGMLGLAKLQIAFQANPKDLETLALLARAFGAIGQAAKAIEVQKEMARLAREQGKLELFRQIVDKLVRAAPNDEGVRALAGNANAPASAARAAIPAAQERVQRASVEELSHEHVVENQELDEDAFDLQTDRPPPRVSAAPLGGALPRDAQEDSYEAAPEVAVDENDENLELLEDEAPDGDEADVAGDVQGAVHERVLQALADAASFRRVRLYSKAIGTLRGGIDLEPGSIELHETLRDILVESHQYEQAAVEMLVLASIEIDAGDIEGAARSLYDVLSIEPENEKALEMLSGLGYELPAQGAEAPAPSQADDGRQAHARAAPSQRPHAGLTDIDDPFDAPLPSFPLDAPESDAAFELVHGRPPPQQAEQSAGFAAVGHREARHTEVEDALEEVDFYASRGLCDDARAILVEQLAMHPNHILLRERLSELDAQDQGARGGSGTRAVPQLGGTSPSDRSFDIAASLDAIENLDTAHGLPRSFEPEGKQVDVEEVFAQFKEGVAKQVAPDDAQSHYDLGVAYKEMGLTEDAIREFDVAARDPKRECVCRSMVGMIQMERGRMTEAIDALMRGLAAKVKTPEQETVLSYELGCAYEETNRTKEALGCFQRVMRRDANYRDVEDRVRRLTTGAIKLLPRAAAVGDDDFDRVFDDLLGDKPT